MLWILRTCMFTKCHMYIYIPVFTYGLQRNHSCLKIAWTVWRVPKTRMDMGFIHILTQSCGYSYASFSHICCPQSEWEILQSQFFSVTLVKVFSPSHFTMVNKNSMWSMTVDLTHCSLVTPDDIDPRQHWLRLWLVAGRHQPSTWTNVDLTSMGICSILLGAMLQNMLMNLMRKMHSKIIFLKLLPHFPGAMIKDDDTGRFNWNSKRGLYVTKSNYLCVQIISTCRDVGFVGLSDVKYMLFSRRPTIDDCRRQYKRQFH